MTGWTTPFWSPQADGAAKAGGPASEACLLYAAPGLSIGGNMGSAVAEIPAAQPDVASAISHVVCPLRQTAGMFGMR